MNPLYVSVQTVPVNGVTDRRFRHERSHSYIFLLTLISATSLYYDTRHRAPEYRLPRFTQIAIARFAMC